MGMAKSGGYWKTCIFTGILMVLVGNGQLQWDGSCLVTVGQSNPVADVSTDWLIHLYAWA